MTETPLDRLAKRAAADPFFLGFRLVEFATAERLDDAALAARLGCEQATLTHLRLCRAPRTGDPAAFREDVVCVAAKFGVNPVALAEAAKPILASARREAGAAESAGAVLAARDRGETT